MVDSCQVFVFFFFLRGKKKMETLLDTGDDETLIHFIERAPLFFLSLWDLISYSVRCGGAAPKASDPISSSRTRKKDFRQSQKQILISKIIPNVFRILQLVSCERLSLPEGILPLKIIRKWHKLLFIYSLLWGPREADWEQRGSEGEGLRPDQRRCCSVLSFPAGCISSRVPF